MQIRTQTTWIAIKSTSENSIKLSKRIGIVRLGGKVGVIHLMDASPESVARVSTTHGKWMEMKSKDISKDRRALRLLTFMRHSPITSRVSYPTERPWKDDNFHPMFESIETTAISQQVVDQNTHDSRQPLVAYDCNNARKTWAYSACVISRLLWRRQGSREGAERGLKDYKCVTNMALNREQKEIWL